MKWYWSKFKVDAFDARQPFNRCRNIEPWNKSHRSTSNIVIIIANSNAHFIVCNAKIATEVSWRSFISPVKHYIDVMMGAVASQITSFRVVYSTVYSDSDQRKHQSCAPLAFVRGIHRGPHKWSVTRKMFLFDDVIMENGRLWCWCQYRCRDYGYCFCDISIIPYQLIAISHNAFIFFRYVTPGVPFASMDRWLQSLLSVGCNCFVKFWNGWVIAVHRFTRM